MRVLIRATLDPDTGNDLMRSGAIASQLAQLLPDLKPEASSFFSQGQRAMHFSVNLEEEAPLVTQLKPL